MECGGWVTSRTTVVWYSMRLLIQNTLPEGGTLSNIYIYNILQYINIIKFQVRIYQHIIYTIYSCVVL